ncbi:MAG: 6-bladed beta-propeller [Tannerella sp.]|nr:6-bladed beta-propeller [Tannerella sp.]
MDDILTGSQSSLYLIDNYLFIKDNTSFDALLHIVNKNSFSHAVSVIPRGQGPGEITSPGSIVFDKVNRKFYFTDLGKYKIFSYDLDSLLADPSYKPAVRMDINEKKVPGHYYCINDTLSIGTVLESVGPAGFKQTVGRWNMNTGEIAFMKYEHPAAEEKKHISFAVSPEHGVYVVCYHDHDLITVCSLDGNLMYNIYGPKWNRGKTNKLYFNGILFCGDKFLTTYNGEDTFVNGERGVETSKPTKFFVFSMNGDYLQTLETEYRINSSCYDSENNRILLNLDDEIQFAYLELNGLI